MIVDAAGLWSLWLYGTVGRELLRFQVQRTAGSLRGSGKARLWQCQTLLTSRRTCRFTLDLLRSILTRKNIQKTGKSRAQGMDWACCPHEAIDLAPFPAAHITRWTSVVVMVAAAAVVVAVVAIVGIASAENALQTGFLAKVSTCYADSATLATAKAWQGPEKTRSPLSATIFPRLTPDK